MLLIWMGAALAWAEEAPMQISVVSRFEEELENFPESYRPLLLALHEKYPNWVFVAEDTGEDWWEAVRQELGQKSVLQLTGTSSAWLSKEPGFYLAERNRYLTFDAGGWVAANQSAVAYWMDPRNFLEEHKIFLFESLSFDPQYHTEAGVEAILQGTFMARAQIQYVDAAGESQSLDLSYAQALVQAAENTGVSPYYLAAKIRSEICHRDGSPSASVTGISSGYEGIYNFYNIGAYDGAEPIISGLTWAGSGENYGRPWDTPYKSIVGGAQWIGESYINRGQDTNYLQRFNVAPDPVTGAAKYTHQYMTNLNGAVSASLKSYDAYAEMGALEQDKLFRIPVYRNMPALGARVYLTEAEQTGTIILQGVNVRTGPGVGYDSLGVRLGRGDIVRIYGIERINDPYRSDDIENLLAYPYWVHIGFESGGKTLEGYVCSEYVDVDTEIVLRPGEQIQLPWAMMNAGLEDVPIFESDDYTVATVDATGRVTAHQAGLAIVTAYATGGMDSVGIRVEGGYLEGYQEGYQAGYEEGLRLGQEGRSQGN